LSKAVHIERRSSASAVLPLETAMYGAIFAVLSGVCIAVRCAQHFEESKEAKAGSPGGPAARPSDFNAFQLNYLLVYLLAVMADWLQGPYVYALYTEYGFDKAAIGQLFIAGFGSSAVFGTFVGSIADKYGRKTNVIVYAVTYALSCATKHSPDFNVLMVGRLLAGIATSILFSAFESWLVSEHNRRGYEQTLLSETFSKAQFGNAVVAIVSGQIAGGVASKFGKVSPFDTAAAVLGALALIVMLTWTENFGDQRQSVGGGLSAAWTTMISDEKILLVGTIQSCFESAMYLMVFSWTPALQAASDASGMGEIPHGMIFSSFMVSIMIGSSMFTFLLKQQPIELFTRNAFFAAVLCFAVTTWSSDVFYVYFALLVFEIVCGIYFPAMGTMRAKYVPEETRSAVMNFLRVPLNVIVCATLWKNLPNERVFQFCAILLGAALLSQHRLFCVCKASIGTEDAWANEERQEMLENGEVPDDADK
jgi:MFS transporter, MFS domain-containing protein family, molybdate-anion transporter